MAQVPYDQGVPFASPAPDAPQDYQHIEASPAEFGGLLAQGAEKLGAGVSAAGHLFGQIASQQAVNNFQDTANEVLKNFKALKGQDAMSAQDDTLQALKDAEQEGASSLGTADSRLAFEQNVRYLRARYEAEIGNHYDQQAQVWGVGVNETTVSLGNQKIVQGSLNNDPAMIQEGASLVANGRVAQAQLLRGTLTPDMLLATQQQATGEAVRTQVETLLPRDPARAASILSANADKLPAPVYEALSRTLKAYTDGISLGAGVSDYVTNGPSAGGAPSGGSAGPKPPANVVPPSQRAALLQQAVAGTPIPISLLDAQIAQESGWDAGSRGSAGEIGLAQIKPSTATAPGVGMAGVDPATLNDPAANLRFGAQYLYARGKAAGLTDADWKDPAKVAIALKQYNGGGDPDYVKHVTDRMAPGGVLPASYSVPGAPDSNIVLASTAPGATPGSAPSPGSQPPTAAPGVIAHDPAGVHLLAQRWLGAEAEAAKRFPNNPVMQKQFVDGVKQNINETMALQNRDQMLRDKARKDASEAAALNVMHVLHQDPANFDPGMIWKIPDSVMTVEERQKLAEVANWNLAQAGVDTTKHGPGWANVYAGITHDPSNPKAVPINTMQDIWVRAGQGGDLTLPDAAKLSEVFKQVHDEPDKEVLHTRTSAMLTYAKQRLTFPDQTVAPGYQVVDRQGEDIFNAQFVQAYTQDVEKAVATGKQDQINDVLSRPYVDKLAGSMRSQKQIDQARLEATGQQTPGEVEKPGTPIPPPPKVNGPDGKPVDVNPVAWQSVMGRPPNAASGQPFTHAAWATYLTRLLQNPDEKTIQYFDQHVGTQGYSGADIVKSLTTGTQAQHDEQLRAVRTGHPLTPTTPAAPPRVTHGPRFGQETDGEPLPGPTTPGEPY